MSRSMSLCVGSSRFLSEGYSAALHDSDPLVILYQGKKVVILGNGCSEGATVRHTLIHVLELTLVSSSPFTTNDLHISCLDGTTAAQQLATTIAPHVQTLTIFGPSKHWYLPRPTLPAPWLFDLLCKYTITGRKLLRFALFAACEDGFRAMHCESGRAYRAKQEKVSRELWVASSQSSISDISENQLATEMSPFG